jgi:hypothetical protein
MHSGTAPYIHKVLGLQFDFTFKRVDGQMDEWEVVGFIDSLQQRELRNTSSYFRY